MTRGTELTPQHQAFARHLAAGMAIKEASVKAGFRPQSGYRIARRADVKAEVAHLVEEAGREVTLDANTVIEALSELALFDPIDCLDEDGNLLPLQRMPRRVRRCIKKFKAWVDPDTGETRYEYEFVSKERAIDLSMKFLKLIGPEVNVSIDATLGDRVTAARQRALQHLEVIGSAVPVLDDRSEEEI